MKLIKEIVAIAALAIAFCVPVQASDSGESDSGTPLKLTLDGPYASEAANGVSDFDEQGTDVFNSGQRDYNDFNYTEKARFAELEELVKRRVFDRQDAADPLWQ